MTPLRAAALAAVIPIIAGCVEKPIAPASVPEAAAHPCPSGWTPAERVAKWREIVPGIEMHVYEGQRGRSAVALFNSLTPPPDVPGDVLAIGLAADTANALVIVGHQGCAIAEVFPPRKLAEQIIARMDGLKVNQ